MSEHQVVVIVGGGIIGSLSAFFLKKLGFGGRVIVLEKDPTYEFSSTARSAASLRTQFGCAINIKLSMFGAQFLRDVGRELGQDVDLGFVERGYLILTGGDLEAIAANVEAARQASGVAVQVLDPDALAARFPWVSTDGLTGATFGLANEGWFDAWSLLQASKSAARAVGAEYRATTVAGFGVDKGRITQVVVDDAQEIACDWVVNAAGAWSGRLAALVGVHLPVVPRKRTVFSFRAPLEPHDVPMVFDTSGAWMRPEGEGFIGGIQPPPEDDADATDDFEPHHDLFESSFWPAIAGRVPALEQIRLISAWAGHYEVNTLDHNGVVGAHPDLPNLVLASGFSGHGLMHAPGVGRGVAELIIHGQYRSIDLTPLGYDRIAENRPLVETVVY